MIRRLIESEIPRRTRTVGPTDHGRSMTMQLWQRCREEPGYVYEIIDGALVVSPSPLPPHDYWVQIILDHLRRYSAAHPAGLNWITERCDVVVPGRSGETRPQPDIAAFRDYPTPPPARWDDVCPHLVVEVISARRSEKDTKRNRHLYWLAEGIAEYWIVDPREDDQRPTLITCVRRRGSAEWAESVTPFGKTFKSPTLRGLSVILGRRARRSGS